MTEPGLLAHPVAPQTGLTLTLTGNGSIGGSSIGHGNLEPSRTSLSTRKRKVKSSESWAPLEPGACSLQPGCLGDLSRSRQAEPWLKCRLEPTAPELRETLFRGQRLALQLLKAFRDYC